MRLKIVATVSVIALLLAVAVLKFSADIGVAAKGDISQAIGALINDVNAELKAQGAGYRLGEVDYYTAKDEVGRTVFFSDLGDKRLAFDFVPGDSRRTWSGAGEGDDITWTSDLTDGDAGVGTAATQTAISSAMATWNDIKCSNIPLTSVPATGDVGFVEAYLTGGLFGSFVPAADVVHAGFGTIVDVILPTPIIAAAFTVFFVDGSGSPTYIDDNGKLDAALREIYYTLNFSWGINTNFPIDVETVALHEAGHGLSQAHFGKLFRTEKNGKFHFAPRAVMNAGYTGQQHKLAGSDKGGHCSNWANWPQN